MLIESIIRRPKGTHVDLGDGVTYSFLPDEAGRHVAEVDDDEHIAAFLRISEGYRLARAVKTPKTVIQIAADQPIREPPYSGEAALSQPGAAVPADPVPASLQFSIQPVLHVPTEDGEDTPKEEREKGEVRKGDDGDPAPSHDDLVKAYTAKFNRAPHHKMTDANILKHLKGED